MPFASIFETLKRNVETKLQETGAPSRDKRDKSVCPSCGGDGMIIVRDANGRNVACPCRVCNAYEKQRVARLLIAANLPEKTANIDVSPHEQTRRFIDEFSPTKKSWLLFVGKPGSGKTTEASWAARKLICERQVRTRFYNAFDLTRQLVASKKRNDDHSVIIRDLNELDLIVIDDLFKIMPSPKSYDYADFVAATLEIVWTRYDAGKPLILTTQSSFDKIAKLDAALAGRIAELSRDSAVIFDRESTNWRIER